MKKIFTFILGLASTLCSYAQQSPFDIDLWPSGLPNTNGIDQSQPFADKSVARRIYHLCLPGGGYSHLATSHEGYDWAQFFNERGIALIVLKYRMPHGNPDVPISDAKEALRIVRENAAKWNIDPKKVGIMGSSAGGHLATTIATHCNPSIAPAFQILFYPVVTFDYRYTHKGSRHNLIGKEADATVVNLYSNEQQVTSTTSPAILLLSDDDSAVPSPNSVNYYLALKRCGIKATMHIYPSGGHGWGCRSNFRYHNEMLADLSAWIESIH